MDTSETYIKMCEKAEEIQSLKSTGYLHKSTMGTICHGSEGTVWWGKPTDEIISPFVVPMLLAIWLPRQDELQEMLGFEDRGELTLLRVFDRLDYIFNRKHPIYFKQFTSLEQFWLAFVMKENHNKVWEGEEWKTAKSLSKV